MKLLRTDIQALRGLAVLLVLLFHAKFSILPAGYLGVDIFFVISGFLITGLVCRAIDKGSFRFADFYWRRAKRLLPAAYVTFALTTLFAPVFLERVELQDFARQLLGAVTFTGNIALFQQAGYFDSAGEHKPLLHVWSLALEEQYYFLLPALLVFLPQPRRLRWMLLGVAASLGLCLLGNGLKPVATFYLLPTRWWELGIGSIGAICSLTQSQNRLQQLSHWLFWPSLLLLLLLPFWPLGGAHPGADAVLVCLATLMVILRNHPLLGSAMPAGVLARVGDFSYSLYLVHWPLFAFANNAWIGEPIALLPMPIRIALLALSLLLGWLLYQYVELPVRDARFEFSMRLFGKGAIASLTLVLAAFGVASVGSAGVGKDSMGGNKGFGPSCDYESDFQPTAACRNSEQPQVLVWGDSYAMHLVPGMVASVGGTGVIQATRSNCGPLLDIAPVMRASGKVYNDQWAEQCMRFNRSVLDYLRSADSVQQVVLSSQLVQYLNDITYVSRIRAADGSMQNVSVGTERALAGLQRTVAEVRALGKKVVLVAPPPGERFNIGSCLRRKAAGVTTFGAPADCSIDVFQYHQSRSALLALLDRVPGEAGVDVFRFDPYLCNQQTCASVLDGTFVYLDGGHLSPAGSRILAHKADLSARLRELAQ